MGSGRSKPMVHKIRSSHQQAQQNKTACFDKEKGLIWGSYQGLDISISSDYTVW